MGKFRPIFTELSARDSPILSFPDDNFTKLQEILTKLAICIDIIKIWLAVYYACGAFIFINRRKEN